MQGALTALNSSIIGAMRALLTLSSSLTSVPENQPPHSVTSAFLRIGNITLGSSGKRRPFSMPVNPAERDCLRHSSSDTSSLSSTRSSFHQAMGDMPSLAFIDSSCSSVKAPSPGPSDRPLPQGRGGDGARSYLCSTSPSGGEVGAQRRVRGLPLQPLPLH